MTVYVFGNPDVPEDSLPLRLLPSLRQHFPHIAFQVLDPNEDWNVPRTLTVLDTVQGISSVRVITDLGALNDAPHITLHDFDVASHLKYLAKLKKIDAVRIIGVPPTLTRDTALTQITATLRSISL